MPFLTEHQKTDWRMQIVACALCTEDIHLTRSSYKEDGGKFYHLEKDRRCWQEHLEEKGQKEQSPAA